MEPVLTKYIREPNSFTLDFFVKHQGYEGLRKALGMQPNAVIDLVKASGLRGRGGAGFPTGLKWQFVLKDTPKPKYIACNADESEPGTFKDHVLMERNPHLLIEGGAISRASSRRSPPSPASISARPRSTTSRRCATCRRSCSTARSGSPRSAR